MKTKSSNGSRRGELGNADASFQFPQNNFGSNRIEITSTRRTLGALQRNWPPMTDVGYFAFDWLVERMSALPPKQTLVGPGGAVRAISLHQRVKDLLFRVCRSGDQKIALASSAVPSCWPKPKNSGTETKSEEEVGRPRTLPGFRLPVRTV